jgi:hypothetical protein
MNENAPLIPRQRPAHWYYPNGLSCHTLPKKDGSGEKNTTLADARKLGLLPSVTSILSIKAKPGLDAWKLEQAILSALTLPRGTEETEDAFAKRIVVDMDEQAAKAAEWGTKIHKECEDMHITGVLIRRDDTFPYVEDYERWFKANIEKVVQSEETVVSPRLGYAGRVDLVARHKEWGLVVIDLKTQKVKKEPVFYEEWGMQLAAYREAIKGRLSEEDAAEIGMVSVIIDSGKPASVAVKLWENPQRYLRAFINCIELWQFDRNYYPGKAD